MSDGKKRLLLVYPEIPVNTYWSFKYALKFVKKKSVMPPLGLVTLAALIPDTFDVKVVDMNIEPLTVIDIQWADAVLISAMIIQKTSFERVVKACNAHGVTVVAGGPYPTASYERIAGVDHFVLGEVEDIMAGFLKDLEGNRAKSVYPAPGRPDITRTVLPRFDLLDTSAYASMAIQYSRGCPFHCEFCDIWKVFGNKPRLKSSENILAELAMLEGLGWRGSVFIVDDNFIGNKRRLKTELLPALIKWQQDHDYIFQFYTETSINLADDADLMTVMREAGFNQVFVGIETPLAASLRETGKLQNLRIDLKSAVRTIQENGIEVMGGFILGFDNDTEDIFDRQIDFIQQTGIVKAMIGLLNALPGTDLHRRLESEGRLLGECRGNNTHDMRTNFKTRMDTTSLQKGYIKVLATIYDANLKNYFSRCNRLLDRLENTEHFQRKVTLHDLKTLFKSLCRQAFTPYGMNYLKFVLRNFIRNRAIFGEAMVYAIEGHHLHTITRQTLKRQQKE